MTDYTKLVKALRCCTSSSPDDCDICAYQPFCQRNGTGRERIMIDATAAIEALQEQVRMLDKHDTDLHNEGYDVGYYAGRRDWEPKRGEWVGVSPTVDTVQCSICGGQLFSAELETPYCPYCGAKMEVQE